MSKTRTPEDVATRRDRTTERACGAQHGAHDRGGPSGPAPRLSPEQLAAEQLAAEHNITHPLSAHLAHEAAALLAAAT